MGKKMGLSTSTNQEKIFNQQDLLRHRIEDTKNQSGKLAKYAAFNHGKSFISRKSEYMLYMYRAVNVKEDVEKRGP